MVVHTIRLCSNSHSRVDEPIDLVRFVFPTYINRVQGSCEIKYMLCFVFVLIQSKYTFICITDDVLRKISDKNGQIRHASTKHKSIPLSHRKQPLRLKSLLSEQRVQNVPDFAQCHPGNST
jgi:hypothetical protein